MMGNIFHIDRRGKGRFEAKLSQYSRRKLSQLVFTAGQKLSNRSSRVSLNGSVRAMVPEDGKFPHPAITVILSSLPLVPYHWYKVYGKTSKAQGHSEVCGPETTAKLMHVSHTSFVASTARVRFIKVSGCFGMEFLPCVKTRCQVA